MYTDTVVWIKIHENKRNFAAFNTARIFGDSYDLFINVERLSANPLLSLINLDSGHQIIELDQAVFLL